MSIRFALSLLVALMLSCSPRAGHAEATETTVKTYATAEEAAIAGFKQIAAQPTAQFYEWGGVIAQIPNGKFVALPPATDYHGDNVGIRIPEIPGLTPVASYHTHPCLPEHVVEYFSPPDLIEAIYFHRIVFMGDFCTGNVHEFKPGDKPDVEHPSAEGEDIYLTKGRIIGTFFTPAMKTAQSWDQANLKANDVGCPTAIFVAPEGNLEQCI